MSRISRGLRLVALSGTVLRDDKQLLIMPAASLLAVTGVGLALFGLVWHWALPTGRQHWTGAEVASVAVFYFCAYAIGIFANAVVIGAASARLRGGEGTLREGVLRALNRLDRILAWALLATTVGLLLTIVESRLRPLGRLVVRVVGAAWSAVTFFVVPVLLYEPAGPLAAVRRSSSLFRARWGEQFSGEVGIGLVGLVAAVPFVVAAVAVAQVSTDAAWLVVAIGVAVAMTLTSTLSAVLSAALYAYAAEGAARGPFTAIDLDDAFPRRRGLFG